MLKFLATASFGPLIALSFVALGCGGEGVEGDESDDPCASVSCGEHGTCSKGACACESGYTGDQCEACAPGFEDPDGDGICTVESTACVTQCGQHGHCDEAHGSGCICDPGYDGASCSACATGFQDNDNDGTCNATCDQADVPCLHGVCEDASGAAKCVCDQGWTGVDCASCELGLQDNDHNDTCLPDCASMACESGSCDDSSGVAVCACDDGYQDNDHDGTCSPDCTSLTCESGSCDDSSGVAVCACDDGYQDNDHDGTCSPDCTSLTCENGSCDDSTGLAVCACDDGYQDNDDDGTCSPDCTSLTCENGSCDDGTGLALCSCDDGYQDNDHNDTCLPDCTSVTCGAHAACADDTGEAICSCESGYVEDSGGTCVEATVGSCLAPIELDIFQAQATGTTIGAPSSYIGSCQSQSGPELVYRFVVTNPLRIRFHMSGFDTVLHMRSNCDASGSELACSDDDGPNQSSIIERDFNPGTYFLFADGYGTSSGAFTLDVELSCADGWVLNPGTGECVVDPCLSNPCTQPHMTQCESIPPFDHACHCDPGYVPDPNAPNACIVDPNPQGEVCADAIWLDPAGGTVQGSTSNAANNYEGTCGGDGPDRVYAFELTERSRAEVAMTGYDTVLHLRSDCEAPGSEVTCNDDDDGMNSGFVSFLDPGSYYLFADSYSQGGDYELEYAFRPDPCAGDPCPGLPECVAAPDWTAHSCVCPSGTVPYGNDCLDDPCEPNLCASGPDHRWRCEPILATATYTCTCSPGYIDDPANPNGACILDPNANEWTFIVFMNGDNNLEQDAFDDLEEMAAVGSTADVHIVALLDTYSANAGNARKLYVTQSGYDVIEDMGELDMGHWETLADFGVWAVENYPARHYALILWDHGDGWKAEIDPSPLTKAFSNDDHGTGDGISISNGDYARALQAITTATGDKLDMVGFDACLMGMWEVAEASTPYAHSFVASEETIPLWGWTYDAFLGPLIANPQLTAHELGISIVDTYHDADPDNSTLALSDLDTMPQLRIAMSAFADALRSDPTQYVKVDTARSASEQFSYGEYRDLWDFADRVSAIGGASAELVAASQALKTQLEVSIVHSRAQSSYPGAHGLSVYLPARASHMDPDYVGAGAVWSQSTTWDDFLTSFAQ